MRRLYFISFILLMALPTNEALAVKKYIDMLPRMSETIPSFSANGLRKELESLPLHHIEGLWRFPSDGTEVAIMRMPTDRGSLDEPEGYGIILLFSRNRALRPGTVIGRISPSAKEHVYEAKIYTFSKGSTLMMPKKFSLQLNSDDSRLVFDQKKSAISFNLWRMLPYAWRYSVKRNRNSGSTSGCIRIYPEPDLPHEPIYL